MISDAEQLLLDDEGDRLFVEGIRRPAERVRRAAPPPPHNDYRLGFAVDRALRAHRQLLHEAFNELGVYPGQEALLAELFFMDGAWTQSGLGAQLGCSRQVVSRSLCRLERAGFVEVSRHHQDGRMNLVLLTPLGEAVLRIAGQGMRQVELALEDVLDEGERTVLRRALSTIADCVDRIIAEWRAPPPAL